MNQSQMCAGKFCVEVFFFLPLLGEVPCYAYAPCAVTTTYPTLIKLQLGADDAVAARPHTLPLHTDRAAVRATLGPVYHLRERESHRHLLRLS